MRIFQHIILFILAICFISLFMQTYIYEMPLLAYNANYPFLNKNITKYFLVLFPYINICSIILLFINKKIFAYYSIVVSLLFFVYHLKLYLDLECPSCASSGLLPILSFEHQLIAFTLLLFFSILNLMLRSLKNKNNLNS